MYSETVLATNLSVFKSTFAQNQKKQDIKTNQNNANHNTLDLRPGLSTEHTTSISRQNFLLNFLWLQI